MRIFLLALAATMPAGLVMATHTPIGHCDSETALFFEVGTGDPRATFYVVREHALGYHWLYQESNGIYVPRDRWHSLQRGLDAALVPLQGSYCIDDPLLAQDARLL